jgi:multiple sugar transport system permease protein
MTTRVARTQSLQGWLFASPYLLHTVIFFALPLIGSIILVFYQWNMISPERVFVGLGNLAEALASPRVWGAMLVSYRFMALYVPLAIAVSLGMALVLNSLPAGKSLYAMAFFLPYLSSSVVLALVVRGVLSYSSPLNVGLRATFGSSPSWLRDGNLAVVVITCMIVWKMAGYYALIFLSGLQSIPDELYEAAELDGAGAWTRLWSITVPLLYPAIYTVLILAVGLVFSIFTEPYVLTGGGPQMATQTWQMEIYYQAFELFRSGYAATVALLNAIVSFGSIYLIRRIAEGWGRSYGWD